jgi:hypothetical protein
LDNPPPEQGQQLLQVNTLTHSTSFVCPLYSLVDHLLPDMDGFEICRRIKANPATAHIPVIMPIGLLGRRQPREGLEAAPTITPPSRATLSRLWRASASCCGRNSTTTASVRLHPPSQTDE